MPRYTIEGPETFDRFADAGIAGQGIGVLVGLIFLVRSVRTGWPLPLAATGVGGRTAR